MNYENVKDALKELITLNDPNTMFGKVSTIIDSGVKTGERKFELKDLQKSNYELLANICDLLGMRLILEGKPEEIQDILSFIHLQQDEFLAVKGVDKASKESLFDSLKRR